MKTPVLPLLHAAALLCAPALASTASAQAPPPAANSTGAEPQPNKASQPDLRTLLRDALFEEEATRDLTKAAVGYEALLASWAEQRPTAAAALYRLAEVRRKQDRKADAIALYQRLLREFPDIEPHARLARENLTALGAKEPADSAAPSAPSMDVLVTEEESTALVRIKKLAAESPDLLIGQEFSTACAKGWLTVVRFLVSKGVNDNGDGFILAAENGHLAVVKELLPQKPLPEFMGRAVDGATVKNRVAVLKLLLEAGASPGGSSDTHEPLAAAILNESGPAVDLLLEHKADPSPSTARISPLYAAASKGSATTVERLLALGADANFGGHAPSFSRPFHIGLAVPGGPPVPNLSTNNSEGEGSTPLHAAVTARSPECVILLLDAKANPNAQSKTGWTPLLGAIEKKSLPLVEQLLAAGADPNLADKERITPLLKATLSRQRDLAAALLKAKASPNALVGPEKNRTAMSYCFDIKDEAELEAWVNLFLEHGANPVWPDAPAINYAPPAWKLKLCRSQVYPMMALTPSIVLIFPEENQLNWLAHRKDENEKPGTLPALLTVWHEKGGWEIPDGGRFATVPDWSTLRLWRKGADGKMQETLIEVKKETTWPELQWGDVIEVCANAANPGVPLENPPQPARRRVTQPGNQPPSATSALPAEALEALRPAK